MIVEFKKSKPMNTVNMINAVEDQSQEQRTARVKKCNCPLHDKPMLQSDVWYRPRNGQRYTFIACMDPTCRIEAITNGTFDKVTLVKEWQFLLEQDNTGCATVLTGPFGK